MIRRFISVADIQVNSENPRFEPVKSQREAIDHMLRELGKEILHLATDIAQYGVNPSKSLIVFQKDGRYFPLEGNRRIVALKLLHNPDLATDPKLKAEFEKLRLQYAKSIPDKIDCVIATDRVTANRWVHLEHTGKNNGVGVVPWNSTQQQRADALQKGKRTRGLRVFDFADKHKIDHRDVDLTTLNRILTTAQVPERIGVSFANDDFRILDNISENEVVANMIIIFAEMSKRTFKVKDVYYAADIRDWVNDKLDNGKHNRETKENKDSGKTRDGEKSTETKDKPNQSTRKKGPLEGDWISHSLCAAYNPEDRVKALLFELKTVNPDQKPNMCAVSLRVLLETALYKYLADKGEIAKIVAEERARIAEDNRKRTAKNPDANPQVIEKNWSPSFHRMLVRLASEELLLPDPLDRKALDLIIGKSSNERFLMELNQSVHNSNYEPSTADVKDIWKKLGKLIFRGILQGQGK